MLQTWLPIVCLICTILSITTIVGIFTLLMIIKEFQKFSKILMGLFVGLSFQALGFLMACFSNWIYYNKPINQIFCVIETIFKIFGIQLTAFFSINVDICLYLNIFDQVHYQKLNDLSHCIYLFEFLISFLVAFLQFYLFNIKRSFIFSDVQQVYPFPYMNCFCSRIYTIIVLLPFFISYLINLIVLSKIVYFHIKYSFDVCAKKKIIMLLIFPIMYSVILAPELILEFVDFTKNTSQSIDCFAVFSFIIISLKGLFFGIAFGLPLLKYQISEKKQRKQNISYDQQLMENTFIQNSISSI